jgi:DNA-binding transcriptional ArsR family regulator
MDADKITLDRDTFKALAVDSRVKILKILDERQHTLTDLSEELEMAPSTIKEHLETLVAAGLIKQVDKGMKWKYYKLTMKGKQVVNPYEQKVWIILATSLLALGFAMSSMFGKLNGLVNVPYNKALQTPSATNFMTNVAGNSGEGLANSVAGSALDTVNQTCAQPSMEAAKAASTELYDVVTTTISRGADNITREHANAIQTVAHVPYLEIIVSLAFVLIIGVCIGYLIKKKRRI